jgi:undecaprenyl-diphosphatase
MVLITHLLGWKNPSLFFNVMVHFATLIAVLWAMWSDIKDLFKSFINLIIKNKEIQRDKSLDLLKSKIIWLLFVGTIPAALLGYLAHDFFERLFGIPIYVVIALFITGILLFIEGWMKKTIDSLEFMKLKDAVLIGIAQAIAIVPGISRSAITTVMGRSRGLSRENSLKFSFLLSVPIISLATIYETFRFFKEMPSNINITNTIFGMLFALVTGFLSIKLLLNFFKRRKLRIFSLYCWALSIFSFIVIIIRK